MLLLHTSGPTGWDDLYGGHDSFVEAAKARGLFEDFTIWVETILEAIVRLPSLRRRINWVAVLFANAGIMDASNVLDKIIADLRKLLSPRRLMNRPLDESRKFVLFRLELVFRLQNLDPGSFESCCERLGLGQPEGFEMSDDDFLNVFK